MPGARPLPLRLDATFLTGRALYDEVIRDGILEAKRSIWIATANVKELHVEPARSLRPGRAPYRSIVEIFAERARAGVEIRLLYAELPSRRFRAAFDRRKRLIKGDIALKHCPRQHLKAVIVDGEKLYLGSANLTGAGLGVKGEDRRNFEIGFVTGDYQLLDWVQTLYQELWDGVPCATCGLREVCPDPGPHS
jgi:phosphatidylserine/phosphatidylglycerophosphate/cardiolipin synthase-like enzyme